ncbi:regucalcin-like isoform X1 [Mytilus trossulus]|uniref:regucalcin-like isoform X1 n=1 Tax=Mytilus trossulus TaxID=6551 RepID=UPI0030041809
MSVEVLLENVFTDIGEGPHWDEATHTLYFVDNIAQRVFSWNYKTKEVQKIQLDKYVGFIIPRAKNGHVIGYGNTISALDWDTKNVSLITEVDTNVATNVNDAKCDARGRLWFGTLGVEISADGKGSLFCLYTDGTVKKQMEKIAISNGLTWTCDNKRMYYIDSIPGKVYGMDYDIETGTFSKTFNNTKVIIDFKAIGTLGFPDGMTIDTEDKLWIACFNGGKIVRFDPDTGKQLKSIDFPAKRISSCCFGGPNYDELFVTCGRMAAPEEELKEFPLSGSLFRVTGLGVKGLKASVYQG